ncbi:site-specific integrase [Kitasatospora sp. NPDC052896]|uniref:site-specific integrase n=1 Tax=Kitasatospora sp. NPDC052896 TaxID=3364061 RepID=UPI0037CC7AF6
MLTHEFVPYETRHRPGRAKPFQVRWRVGRQQHSKSYLLKAQADGRRAELMAAARRREQFDEETGLPVSELEALRKDAEPTWFDHARKYAEMKWRESSAKERSARADGLATLTPALVTDHRGTPSPKVLRRALSCWAFNFSEHLPEPPEPIAEALVWIGQKSLPISQLEDSDTIRNALKAISLKLDGGRAADNTIRRKYATFSNALNYGIEQRYFTANPLKFVDWTPPEIDSEIDWRYVPNPRQCRDLIEAARGLSARGRHLATFYGCINWAATRPAEAMNLRLPDFELPGTGWGLIVAPGSSPRVGSRWTDDGKSYEERGLKRRARGATRDIPIPPVFVRMVREHVEEFGLGEDGHLFRAAEGGLLTTKEYAAVWKEARKLVLPPQQVETPLADVPYSLRAACVSGWITAGVPPAEVARRAGHSVAVLYKFYAKVLDGRREQDNALIERFLTAEYGPE